MRPHIPHGLKRRLATRIAVLGALLCLAWPAFAQPEFRAQITDVPVEQSGIRFVHTDGNNNFTIVETVIGSMALFDYDQDGWIDIYFVNGRHLDSPSSPQVDGVQAPTHRLYRNNGNWTFSDRTEAAGLGDSSFGMGVVVGDYDNDGDPDLFLSNFGTNTFYQNEGDGTFRQATLACGLLGEPRFGAGNTFVDIDNDGDLDLYTASYVEFTLSDHSPRFIGGYEFNPGPRDYPPAADVLYENDGQGRFIDISHDSGIDVHRAAGMGVLSADFDDDGDQDIWVANDQYPNFMWLNDGTGHFSEEALLAGTAVDRLGRTNGNMGVDYADLDGDGLLDLFTTSYQGEMPIYYQSVAPGMFADRTNVARVEATLNSHVTWGVGCVDFDLDGNNELFLACGHFLKNIRQIDDRTDVRLPNYLLANDGHGHFHNITASSGSALQSDESSRGAGFDDLDNDGDPDLVVLNVNAAPTLGRTDISRQAASVSLTLIGTRCNRDAYGSKVVLHDGSNRRTQYKTSSRGYESSYGSRLLFAVSQPISKIEVSWPSGESEQFEVEFPTSSKVLIQGTGTPR